MPTLAEAAILVGFFAFVAVVGHLRLKLDRALEALPPEVRRHLGLEGRRGSPRRRRRAIADRLMIHGLPPWVPLDTDARTALARLRVTMLGFLAVLALAPALAAPGPWGFVGVPLVLAVIGLRALAVRAWPEAPDGGPASNDETGERTTG